MVEIREFVGSDLDASVIASASARSSLHGETVVRFLKKSRNPLIPHKNKTSRTGFDLCSFWWTKAFRNRSKMKLKNSLIKMGKPTV